MLIRRIRGHEKGSTAIIVAAALVALMGMAAIVVDGGRGFSERRQAQSGADFSTLAAAQFSDPTNPAAQCPATMDALTRATCRGAVEAMAVVDGNLPSAALTSAEWLACIDPDHFIVPATVDFGSGGQEIECISFSGTTQDARVQVPTIEVATTFGRVLGFNFLNVDAFAEVHASLPEEYRVLPFGIPANSGRFDCLKASQHPDWGVCAGGSTNGNYGYLDIPTYGNEDLGTTFSNCTTPNNVLLSNMILGVDHGLGSHANGTKSSANPGLRDGNVPETNSINVCPVFGSNANEVNVQTGVVQSVITQGLTHGFGSTQRGPMWGSTPWRDGNGPTHPAISLDNTPLWAYLIDHSFCPSGTAPTTTQDMADCLNAWQPADGIVFSSAITSNGRYAFAPRLWGDFSSSGWYLIEQLQPIYLNTSYWGCQGSGECEAIHAPGDAPSPIVPCSVPPTPFTGAETADQTCYTTLPLGHNTQISAVASFNLERGMLPAAALDPVPSDGPLLDFALTK